MHMIGHDTRRIEFKLPMLVRVQDTLEYQIALRGGELTAFHRRERDHVLRPGTFKVREVAAGILYLTDAGRLTGNRRGRRLQHARARVLPGERGTVFLPAQ